MNNPSFNFELSSKANANGEYSVRLRITFQKTHKRISTGITVNKNDFNPKAKSEKWIRNSCSNAATLNNNLYKLKNKAYGISLQLKEKGIIPTGENIVCVMNSNYSYESFLTFANNIINNNNYSAGTKRSKESGLKRFSDFLLTKGKKDLRFNEITLNLINEYDNYLHGVICKQTNQRLTQDYINKLHKDLRVYINEAVLQNIISESPYKHFKKKKDLGSHKVTLNIDEIAKLESAEFSNNIMWANVARDMFLFSFYLGGIRFSDVLMMRWSNFDEKWNECQYTMKKNKKTAPLEVPKQIQDILAKYYNEGCSRNDFIFPLLKDISTENLKHMSEDDEMKLDKIIASKNSIVNKALNYITKKLGLEKHISFHCARHSFAKYACDNKMNIKDIQEVLRHTNLKETQQYIGQLNNSDSVKKLFEKSPNRLKLVQELNNLSEEDLNFVLTKVK